MKSVVRIVSDPCPNCGGRNFKYNPPEERRVVVWRGVRTLIKKYTCVNCGMQLD